MEEQKPKRILTAKDIYLTTTRVPKSLREDKDFMAKRVRFRQFMKDKIKANKIQNAKQLNL
jgi:hypothetical protein